MLRKIRSFLFPEFDELQKRVEAYEGLVYALRSTINLVTGDCNTNTKSIGILIDKIQRLEDQEPPEIPMDLINNLQVRVLGLEEKYQNHKDYQPIPTGRLSFRTHRQSLERGAYAKSRNSSAS